MHAGFLSRVWFFATLWTVALQAPLSIGFSRREYWTGLPFSSPGETPWPRDRICTPCIGRRILYHWTTWEALLCWYFSYNQYKVFKLMSILYIKIWTLPFVNDLCNNTYIIQILWDLSQLFYTKHLNQKIYLLIVKIFVYFILIYNVYTFSIWFALSNLILLGI